MGTSNIYVGGKELANYTSSTDKLSLNSGVAMDANHSGVKTALNASGSAPIFACRAWINCDGSGTVSIRDSGNISGLTDNGTGDYTISYTTAMPTANYSLVSNYTNDSGNNNGAVEIIDQQPGSSRFITRWPGNSAAIDMPRINVIICV